MEIDEYDDEDAVYILAIDQRSEVKGSVRLLPSWRRSLMRDRLLDFVTNGAPPIGPDIWEWTRWVPGDASNPRALVKARKVLILGCLEFALTRGVRQFTAVCETQLLPQLVELGWNPRPLGMPTRFAEGTAIALCWDVNPTTLQDTKTVLNYRGPAAIETPAACRDETIDLAISPAFFAAAAFLASTDVSQISLMQTLALDTLRVPASRTTKERAQ
jgi:acyl-homoserine lactone synthase